MGRSEQNIEALLDSFRETFTGSVEPFIQPDEAGYLEHFFGKRLAPTKAILRMVSIYAVLALILSVLGLVAMSTYYVTLHRKDTAIRKVFGSTGTEEIKRGVLRYLRVTVHSGLLGVMLAVAINTSILRSYTYRLSFTAWIYIGAMLLIVMIAFLAVFFQVRNVAGKDPVRYLREE